MAIPFLNHLDLRSVSELQNALLHKTTESSASDVEAKIIYDTGTNSVKYYNGSNWIEVGGSKFDKIAVSGQSNIVADSSSDTLTFAEGSNITITTNASTDTLTIASTQLTEEEVEDIVGGMVTGNTETGISVTYEDSDGTLDFVVDDTTFAGDTGSAAITPGTTLTIAGGTNVTTSVTGSTLTIASTDTNTDTLQTTSADTTDNDRFITSVANAAGAQQGFTHATLKYNPSTETLKVTNLEVSGTSTTVNTEEINLADNIITLNSNATGSASENAGLEIERGDDANVKIQWNETDDDWEYQAYNHATTPALVTYKIPTTHSATIGDASATTITVDHNLGSRDVIVQLYDASSYETVYADVVRTNTNRITLTFANAPALNDIKVLVSKVG